MRRNSILTIEDYDGLHDYYDGLHDLLENDDNQRTDDYINQKFIKQMEKGTEGFVSLINNLIEASNQVGIIMTLIMGTSMGILTSLVGHWWDNSNTGVIKWKITGVVVSCILSIFVSSINILWSFIFSTKYSAIKHKIMTRSVKLNLDFEKILTPGMGNSVDSVDSVELELKELAATTAVSQYKVESTLLSCLTFASMIIFPITCLFGCLVSMTDNDIIKPKPEPYARNSGADIDQLEIAMLSLMSVLASVYLCIVIYGVYGVYGLCKTKEKSGLNEWAERIDSICKEMTKISRNYVIKNNKVLRENNNMENNNLIY